MLSLRDFYHLPELEATIRQVLDTPGGLVLVAGFNPRINSSISFPGSGRGAMLALLMTEYLAAHPQAHGLAISHDSEAIRIPREYRHRMRQEKAGSKLPRILDGVQKARPDLVVFDTLDASTLAPALEIGANGVLVLSQIDTPQIGAGVVQHLQQLGASHANLTGLKWVIGVERLPALCLHCRQPDRFSTEYLPVLRRMAAFSGREIPADWHGFTAAGCEKCNFTGRLGEVAVFDFYAHDAAAGDFWSVPGKFSRFEYIFGLVKNGYLAIRDIFAHETDRQELLHRMLVEQENSLEKASSALRRRLVELEAANLVLQQRTEQLISLQGVSQSLIGGDHLPELAATVCRKLEFLCGADYVMMYHRRPGSQELEMLASAGWELQFGSVVFPVEMLSRFFVERKPQPWRGVPPGITSIRQSAPEMDQRQQLRAGLSIPLFAQDDPVGLMVVQSTRKDNFTPGEIALLQTFANQVAVAYQRAGLIDERIAKEKLEQELEVARRMQQALLPQTFPEIPGFHFAAHNRPARWVGGDFYDFFALGEGRFGMVIGDASDKGIPAALYMALTRSLILSEARRNNSPRETLYHVNQTLRELGELRGFISVFLGVLDTHSSTLCFSRAGHERPLLLRGDETLPLGGEGMILGIVDRDELRLSEEVIDLLPGDRLVLFTDGMTDVVNPVGQLLEYEQFMDFIYRATRVDRAQFCGELLKHLDAFRNGADQFDDMTLLVLSVESNET